jgi:hypothetical protein
MITYQSYAPLMAQPKQRKHPRPGLFSSRYVTRYASALSKLSAFM